MRICWILGVVLRFHLLTTVSCLNYTRRKTKSKNPTSVKKWIFSIKEVLQNHPHFGETVWTDFHTAKKKNHRFRKLCVFFCVLHNEEESQRKAVKASWYFNVSVDEEIPFISMYFSRKNTSGLYMTLREG